MFFFFNIYISPISGEFSDGLGSIVGFTTFQHSRFLFSKLEARKLLDQMVAAGGVTDVITYNTLAKVGAKCCDSHGQCLHRTVIMVG